MLCNDLYGKRIYNRVEIYIYMIHFAVHQELT